MCLDKGTWSTYDRQQHINFKELKAVWLALMQFQDIASGKRVRILSDNAVTVFYINKQVGTRSWKQCAVAWVLFCGVGHLT